MAFKTSEHNKMILEVVFLVLIVIILYNIFIFFNHVLQLRNYPPGPFPLPIIGNMHLLTEKPFEDFRDLAKKYGNVFSISFGMQRLVVINTIEPAREALKGNQFAGRPTDHYTASLLSRGSKNIAFGDYNRFWTFRKKLAYTGLKMYGDYLGRLESKVIIESEELHLRLKENEGKPAALNHEFGVAVLNIICNILFGQRYEPDDAEFLQVSEFSRLLIAAFDTGSLDAYFPWLRFFPMKGLSHLRKYLSIRDVYLHKKIMEHRNTFDPENIRDFTDALLKCSKEESVWEVTDDHIEMTLNDIFIAGGETTLTVLRWIALYLLHWPQYQDDAYEEVIKVVGKDRYPELNDRHSLPLVQAIIQETLRLSSLLPLSVPHKAIEQGSIEGQNIPKNTQILFNIWNYHHDERYWVKANEFNPLRWLDKNKHFTPDAHKSFLPFSTGRRVCLGETMAKTELFLFFSRLIRDFRIERNPDEPFPSLQGRNGVTLTPFPFTVIFKSRI